MTRRAMVANRSIHDRVLAMAELPEAGRRMSGHLLDAVRGLDLWIWGDLDQPELEEWRHCELDPLTAPYAFEDLLIYATLARDWDAVATAATAVSAIRTRGGVLPAAWQKNDGGEWGAPGLSPPLTIHEAQAVVACARAWDARAARLRHARRQRRDD